ncbi:MAG TPA: hypothetical protein PKV73_01325 [Agriterribacter sp.]|nr:hypothetical protein [Agriterribacter sp.]
MLVKKENENLISRLSNYKFKSALDHLEGESEKVKTIVEALANTFENVGWFGGSLGDIVEAAVTLLIGDE